MNFLLDKLQYSILYLSKYPKIGKFISTILGVFEVFFLDMIYFIDRRISHGSYSSLMKIYTLLYGSKVIPLNVKLEGIPSVAPTDEIMSVIRRMPALSIGYCYCRVKHKNCDNPVWSCIHIGTAIHLNELKNKIPLKSASIEEVEKLLLKANKLGLVHQLLTAPSPDYVYVICNCCPCCCVMLNSAIEYNLRGVAIPSNYIVKYDKKKCIGCFSCVERCHFGSLANKDNKLVFDSSKCVGCGLCIDYCSSDAIQLIRRDSILNDL
ncbi:MAG: 4Fe-4S binding protein [Candidatus Heimdallarchaeota archaeon]